MDVRTASTLGGSLLAAFLLASCAPPVQRGGEALRGIVLVAQRQSLVLSWAPDSPLARMLPYNGVVEAAADYPTAAGPVRGEPVGGGRVIAGSNRVEIPLAASLRNPPTGTVCLRLRIGRSAIPVRAGGGTDSTDTFSYPEWSAQVAGTAQRTADERELAQVRSAVARDNEASASFEAWRKGQGVADAQACSTITAGGSPRPAPRDVLPIEQRPVAARRVCVWRLKRVFGKDTDALTAKTLELYTAQLKKLETDKGAKPAASAVEFLKLRQQHAQSMRTLFQRYDGATSGSYRPELANARELQLTSSVERELKSDGITLGTLGGVLDAFNACIGDSEVQLKLSAEQWEREQNPRLAQARAEVMRSECTARFQTQGQVQKRLSELAAKQSSIESRIAGRGVVNELPASRAVQELHCQTG